MAAGAGAGRCNCIRHLTAIAAEADLDLDVVGLFGEDRTRCGAAGGDPAQRAAHQVWDLDGIGGVQTVMRVLLPRLHGDAMTVDGRSVAQRAERARAADGDVLHDLDDPINDEPGLIILAARWLRTGPSSRSPGVGKGHPPPVRRAGQGVRGRGRRASRHWGTAESSAAT